MTESMSEWPQISALHEQSDINKHSAHNFSTLIHHSDTVYADSKGFILNHAARQNLNMVRKIMIEVIKVDFIPIKSSKDPYHGYQRAKDLVSTETPTAILLC